MAVTAATNNLEISIRVRATLAFLSALSCLPLLLLDGKAETTLTCQTEGATLCPLSSVSQEQS